MSDVARLSVVDVSRYYGRRKALSQVSFSCGAGEIIGLLGPNGAGKSTLLNVIATLVRPSRGVIQYGDRQLACGADVRAEIGMLGHDLFLYPELTARENLSFFAHLYRVGDVPGLVSRALDRAGLADRGDDFIAGFSRGMRQRVALERALLHDPTLILLDEPFTGLDQASTAALVDRLQERQRAGCLIVLATHDLDVADGLLTRAIYLKDGRMVGSDTDTYGLSERYRRAMLA
jgi:heme exporter protein A